MTGDNKHDTDLVTGGRLGLQRLLDAQRANADRVGDGAALDAWAARVGLDVDDLDAS